MKKISTYLTVLIICTQLYSQMSGKRETPYGFEINVKPPIYYDQYITYKGGANHPQLSIDIAIQNDLLFFTKTDEGYVAGYDITIFVKDSATQTTLFSNMIKERVIEKDFKTTNSRERYQNNSKSFTLDIPPGDYDLHLKLTDETTGNTFRSRRKIKIPDLNSVFSATEINLYTPDNSISTEIIVGENRSTVKFNQELRTHLETVVFDHNSISVLSELFYIEDEARTEVKTQQFDLPVIDSLAIIEEVLERKYLKEGDYLLIYTISVAEQKVEVKKNFSVIWYKKPIYLYDLELAVRPLAHILSEEEMDHIESISDSDLKKWFDDFWKKKDPEPEIPYNEIQKEFYTRVLQADRKYSEEYTDGWATDRGKAFILYGQPERIEEYHYLTNTKPYEIWYFDSLNKKLVFIDKNEDNTFHLVRVEDIGEEKNE